MALNPAKATQLKTVRVAEANLRINTGATSSSGSGSGGGVGIPLLNPTQAGRPEHAMSVSQGPVSYAVAMQMGGGGSGGGGGGDDGGDGWMPGNDDHNDGGGDGGTGSLQAAGVAATAAAAASVLAGRERARMIAEQVAALSEIERRQREKVNTAALAATAKTQERIMRDIQAAASAAAAAKEEEEVEDLDEDEEMAAEDSVEDLDEEEDEGEGVQRVASTSSTASVVDPTAAAFKGQRLMSGRGLVKGTTPEAAFRGFCLAGMVPAALWCRQHMERIAELTTAIAEKAGQEDFIAAAKLKTKRGKYEQWTAFQKNGSRMWSRWQQDVSRGKHNVLANLWRMERALKVCSPVHCG